MPYLINKKQIGTTMHTKPKSPVRLSKETDPTKAKRVDCTNLHHRDNVNVAQGPRTGNTSAHAGKRTAFMTAKDERAPLADVIQAAYGERQRSDYAGKDFKNDGSIMPDVAPKRFKK
jgi:hypothetical protein